MSVNSDDEFKGEGWVDWANKVHELETELKDVSDRLGKSLMEAAQLRDHLVHKGQAPDSSMVVWLDKLLNIMCKNKKD